MSLSVDPQTVLSNINLTALQGIIEDTPETAPTKEELKPQVLEALKKTNPDQQNLEEVADWLAGYMSQRFNQNSVESKADDNGSPEAPSAVGASNVNGGTLGKLGNWLKDIVGDARKFIEQKNVADDQHDPNDVINDGLAQRLTGDGLLSNFEGQLSEIFDKSPNDIQDLLDEWLKTNPYTGKSSGEAQQTQNGGQTGTGTGNGSSTTPAASATTPPGTTPPVTTPAPAQETQTGGPAGAGTAGNTKTDGTTNGTQNSGELFKNWPSDEKIQELMNKYAQDGDTAGDSPEAREAQLNAVFNDLGLSPDEKEFFMGMAKAESGSNLNPAAAGDEGSGNVNGEDLRTRGPLSCAMNFVKDNPAGKAALEDPAHHYKTSALLGLMNVRKQMSSSEYGQLSPGRSIFAGILAQHQKGFANSPQSEWQNIANLYKDLRDNGHLPQTPFWQKLLGELGV